MILLTGGSGFLGGALLSSLENGSESVRCLGRHKPSKLLKSSFHYSDINVDTDFSAVLKDITLLIHCAARVHVMNDNSSNPIDEFRKVNTHGTLNLAKQAASAGVKRFVFISSIKVNGESTELDLPFTSGGRFVPTDPYGLSKYEAEVGLRKIADETEMEVVIIRAPLIYGPGVGANFAALLNLVNKGYPLPFGMIDSNKRSMVYIANLVDLIVNCIHNPNASSQTFMVSDEHDLSTRELIYQMGKGLNKKSVQLFVPVWCYRFVGKLFGKSDVIDRLVGTLQVDIAHTKSVLNWTPPYTLEQGMAATAKAFLVEKNK
jgi:UDP-glucose 4-epimerase